MRAGIVAAVFLCCLLLDGCSRKVTDVDLPYDTLPAFSLTGNALSPDRWWQTFNDQKLDSLIQVAMESNLPLNTAWYQFRESGAAVDVASSDKWPQIFLRLQSGINRPEPDFVGGENTQLGLQASYEVDLWGRIRYSVHAEEFRFKASYYDYKTAAISLSAEIALTWFRLTTTNSKLQLLEEQIETNEQVLALIRARFAGGQVRGVDILRQEQLIENTREEKIALEMELALLENQLALLLGRPPAIKVEVEDSLPELPPLPQTGIPLELINRRPDVLSAFYSLQASDREVAAAISNRYPRLSLSMNAAVRSNSLTGLFESQAISITSSLLAPVFYGGRLNAEVDRTEAIRQQLLNEYGQAVLTAFTEVENALVREQKMLGQMDVIEGQVELAGKTYDQLRIEYLNGTLSYLDVLTTLGQQQQLHRELLDVKMNVLESRIALYRALAGGFDTVREEMINVDHEVEPNDMK